MKNPLLKVPQTSDLIMSISCSHVLAFLYIFHLCVLSCLSYLYINLIISILRSYVPAFLYALRLCVLSCLSYLYFYYVSLILCALVSISLSISVPCQVHLIFIIIVSNILHVLSYRLFSVSIIYPICLNFILPFYFKFSYKFCEGRI